mgnify:CR=1 FL=1
MTCCGFRPLSGSYISQYSFAFLFLYQFLTVSVPYRGATFLNEVFKYYKKKNKPVSVPYRGATFLNNIFRLSTDKKDILFPSPIGELHFSIGKIISGPLVNDCFRPLSGSYISQFLNEFSFSYTAEVSVPYRGATFLNWNWGFYTPVIQSFPSPIGELHFSILIDARSELAALSFRPLSGSYISQSYDTYTKILEETVSVPYRGATFLNWYVLHYYMSDNSVSVPYRGATFLNTIPATPCPVWDE